MYHGNRMIVDYAQRLAEERVARSELLLQLPASDTPLRRLIAALPRLGAVRVARPTPFDLETTSG